MPEKLIIIGSGPAGWTAALYAGRANLAPLIFAGRPSQLMLPGGQLMWTTEVENFPGYPDGIDGPEMMAQFRNQALRFGGRVMTDDGPQTAVAKSGDYDVVHHFQDVKAVDFSRRPFRVTGDDDRVHEAEAIVIATGARANYLGLESEKKYMNHGVSGCAVCDGALPRFRNQPIVVVGGGDTAVEEASYLAKFASAVHLIVRRDVLRASKVMADRVAGNPKITLHWHRTVEEVLGDAKAGVTGVRLKSTVDDTSETIPAAGMFLAIGHTPNTEFLVGQVTLGPTGYVLAAGRKPHFTATNVPGVFAAGDVADDTYRQAVTAAGTGCQAALDAERWLAAQGVH